MTTTIVNANTWVYFAYTDDADIVICKICRKHLKGKRSFNLRQHLKKAHKLEVRPDKRLSSLKNQQLPTCSKEVTNTFKSVNFWSYFTNSDRADRVTCKLCPKKFKPNHGFNLRQHLKYLHNIEIRLDKKFSRKKKLQISQCSNETARVSSKTCENSSSESRHAGSSPTNNQLDSNGSYSKVSKSPTIIDIKEECIQDIIHGKDAANTVGQEVSFEVTNIEKDDNDESTHNVPPLLYLPVAVSRENRNGFDVTDPLQGSDLLSNNAEFEPRAKKKKFLDDESTILNRSENFEDWVKRRKHLLEIEEIEMRNYKIKLELWEREQQLNLKCSKFTKDMKIFK